MTSTATPARSVAPTGRAAWMVLGFATLSAGLTGPGQTIGVSVFVDRFVEDLSLTRDQVSAAYLVGTLTGAALLPWVGRQIDRRGVRVAQATIGVFFALALVNMSLVNGLVWLAVGFAGIRFLGQGSLSLVSTVTVSITFRERRGTALGIMSTVQSGLMALVPVGLSLLIAGIGWRQTWLVAAGVIAVTVVPIALFGYRRVPRPLPTPALGADREVADAVESPAHAIHLDTRTETDIDTGTGTGTGTGTEIDTDDAAPAGHVEFEPDGADHDLDGAGHDVAESSHGADFDRREAMTTRSFWMIAAVSGSTGMLSTALNFHQIDLMGDAGISEQAAAALFLPQVVGSTVAGLAVGALADRLGLRYLPAAGMALLIAAHLLGAAISPGPIVILYSIVLGATGGAVRTATSTLLPGWFGTSNLGSIQGALTFFNVAASALGPVVLSVMQGVTDDYAPALLILAVIPAGALLFSLLDDPKRRPLAD